MFDLLDPNSAVLSRGEVSNVTKTVVPTRVPIQIRETVNGGITLAGVTEAEVRSKEEMASYLSRGSLCRATGSTNMNSQSRSSFLLIAFDANACELQSTLIFIGAKDLPLSVMSSYRD